MATYPSEHKILVKVEPMGTIHLSGCNFTVNLFIFSNKKISIPKSECIKKDEDSYVVTFNTRDLGRGAVKVSLNIQIPDADFEDGIKEVNTEPICTGVADI